MGFRNALETFTEESQLEYLRQMEAEECDALFDLLLAGALIDGELSQEEAEVLAEEFDQLPFYSIAHTAQVTGEHGFLRRGELLERINTEGVAPLLDSVAERIPSAAHRQAALRALAIVLEAEGVAPEELGFAMQAAAALGVPGARMLEILRETWELKHPPFARS